MSQEQASYRQIAKATSLFGGVQVFNILLGIARNKALAVLLGPAGMGIAGLLTSTTAMVASLTDLGLATSAVRDIAAADAAHDPQQLAKIAAVLRRMVWLSGLLGTLVTVALAPWLSAFAFGDRSRMWAFAAVAVTLLLNQLSVGRSVLLQGTRRLGDLAQLNVLAGAAGLLVSLPLYVWLGQDGVVPALVASAAVTLAVAAHFGRRVPLEPVAVSWAETWSLGRTMAALGMAVSLNGLLVAACAYLLRVYLTQHGSLADVGLYTAGFGMLNSYVGMIFAAMSADYYPRLSAAIQRGDQWRSIVTQQAGFSLLVLAPVLGAFIVLVRPMIVALYSDRFLAIDGMMRWAALGIVFKVAAWPMGFLFMPKGDTRMFVASEFAANAYMLALSIGGFAVGGLDGLGWGFAAGYLAYFVQVALLVGWRYGFAYPAEMWRLTLGQLGLIAGCAAAAQFGSPWVAYGAAPVLVALSAALSLRELDKRVGLAAIWAKVRQRLGRG